MPKVINAQNGIFGAGSDACLVDQNSRSTTKRERETQNANRTRRSAGPMEYYQYDLPCHWYESVPRRDRGNTDSTRQRLSASANKPQNHETIEKIVVQTSFSSDSHTSTIYVHINSHILRHNHVRPKSEKGPEQMPNLVTVSITTS